MGHLKQWTDVKRVRSWTFLDSPVIILSVCRCTGSVGLLWFPDVSIYSYRFGFLYPLNTSDVHVRGMCCNERAMDETIQDTEDMARTKFLRKYSSIDESRNETITCHCVITESTSWQTLRPSRPLRFLRHCHPQHRRLLRRC